MVVKIVMFYISDKILGGIIMQDMIKMRDTFREAADILDEFIQLKAREDLGEDIEKECGSILGRFMLKMVKLQELQARI